MTTDTGAWWEVAARQFEPRPGHRWDTPGELAQQLDPLNTVATPALDLIDAELVKAYNTPGDRLIISMPPQEGKSTRAAKWFPLWALTHNPALRIALVSYEHTLARAHSRRIRDVVNQHADTLGIRVRDDLSAQAEWGLEGHDGGVYATGIGGALTGRAVDMLIIDDPLKDREQADSPTYRERAWEWWTDTGATRLAPGASVVLILTRWHEDDLAGRLLAGDGETWRTVTIPAQCEDEATDPLRRKLGEFMQSARRRTREEWERIKARSPLRTWASLYQQRPTPTEGAVWKWEWIVRRTEGDALASLARVVVAIDPAAKSKRTSDYTGIIVAAVDHQGDGWVLDDRTIRGTPLEWGAAAWDAVLDWNADEVIIEDNQGGEMVLEVMRNAWQTVTKRRTVRRLAPRVTPITATRSKRTRAEAAAVLYETGRIRHVDDGTGKLDALERQMTGWTGDGDSPDRVDALGHALEVLFAGRPPAIGPRRATPARRRDRTR